MDLLYLVQWLGCVTALAGGVVVFWQPEEKPLTRRRLAALVMTGLVVVLAVARWGVLDDSGIGAERATAVTGQVGFAALVVLALLLSASAFSSPAARRAHRRAAGALCAGFAVAVSATLQIDLVGESWTQTQWMLLVGQVLGCAALVLAQDEN
ncbi:hypothetical protein ACLM5J_09870 [Nocardioides sp. Bht2]|uniref:hypothetical protein n=1 Tax=Nocardioides sp. Bht2 TaxID=3392297 RepID=UPI0039B61B12